MYKGARRKNATGYQEHGPFSVYVFVTLKPIECTGNYSEPLTNWNSTRFDHFSKTNTC